MINQLWVDLKDLAEARRQALAGAKEIHTFDRDALDTKERVQVHTLYCQDITEIDSYAT